MCISSENIQRANTQSWIPLRLTDSYPYPKAGVLLQGRKTRTLGTANPHSIYPVHISIHSLDAPLREPDIKRTKQPAVHGHRKRRPCPGAPLDAALFWV